MSPSNVGSLLSSLRAFTESSRSVGSVSVQQVVPPGHEAAPGDHGAVA